jgi:hypothetical protein
MRIIIGLLLFAGWVSRDAARSQANYDLTAKAPFASSSRSNVTEFDATVVSHRDGKSYACSAERGDLKDALGDRWLSLGCRPDSNFTRGAVSDRDIATKRVPVPAPIEAAQNDAGRSKDYFWRIDRTVGRVQLCRKTSGPDGNCIGSQIQPESPPIVARTSLAKPPVRVAERQRPPMRRSEAPPQPNSIVGASNRQPGCATIGCGLFSLIGVAF